jgi:hypothetical protein
MQTNAIGARQGRRAGRSFAQMLANSPASTLTSRCARWGRFQAANRPQEVAKRHGLQANRRTEDHHLRRSDPFPHVDVMVVASRPVRRILYRALRPGDGHPSRPAIARRLLRPTRGSGGRAAHPLCSALLRVGFVEPPGSPPALVRSYRTVSPLPVRPPREPPSAVCSLWHFPAGRPDWVLPSTLPCGVRTFLGRVTSRARTRPSGRLATTAIVAARDRPCRR